MPEAPTGIDPVLRAGPLVFVDELDAPELDDGDEHHLRRVLRLGDGTDLCVADGTGRWRTARLDGGLVATGEVRTAAAPGPPVTVAAAVPKGDRVEWMVQKLTELGVERIVLLAAERSVVRWAPDRAERQRARLARIAREASMQCRRCTLPTVEGPVPPGALVGPGTAVADPDGAGLGPDVTTVLVGPEGGWAPGERAGLGAGVSLGTTVLRTETAAVVAGTLLVALRSGLVSRPTS